MAEFTGFSNRLCLAFACSDIRASFTVFTALALAGLAGALVGTISSWAAARGETRIRRRGRAHALSLIAAGGERGSEAGVSAPVSSTTFSEESHSVHGPLDIHGGDPRTCALGSVRAPSIRSPSWSSPRSAASGDRKLAATIAIGVLAWDLSMANSRHVLAVPQSSFEGTPRVLKVIQDAEKANPSPGPFRVQRVGTWWPLGWFKKSSPRRLEEMVRWERETLQPKYPLTLGIQMTSSVDSIDPVDFASFFFPLFLPLTEEAARGPGLKAGDKICYQPRRSFDIWNTRYFIVPSYLEWDTMERGYASVVPHSTQIYPPPETFKGPGGPARRAQWEATDDVRVLRNERVFPSQHLGRPPRSNSSRHSDPPASRPARRAHGARPAL